MKRIFGSCLLAFFAFAIQPGYSDTLPDPAGSVILSVSGKIKHTNRNGAAEFDRAMLEALDGRETKTKTPWTDGVPVFGGPLGRSILEAVGAEGTTLRVIALNDYAADVPAEDFYEYPVIFAMEQDGKVLRVRDKGPLFIIYPFDEEPQLLNEAIFSRSVWQVKAIVVE